MCQLNLYMVPKNVPSEDVINIFGKYDLDMIEVTDHYKVADMKENYKFYSTMNHCDCRSKISNLQNENIQSFDVYKIKNKSENVKKLEYMKILKANENYEEIVTEFEERRDFLLSKVENLSKHIGDYEIQELEKAQELSLTEEELRLTEEELRNRLNDVVYPRTSELWRELENTIEYQDASKEFQDFMKKNGEIGDSRYINIEEFENQINEYDFIDFFEEFTTLKDIFNEILQISTEICIYPFWQGGEVLEVNNKREVSYANLIIDDLVFLAYNNFLKIVVIE